MSIDSDVYDVFMCYVDFVYIGYEGKFGLYQLQLNVCCDCYLDFGGVNSYYVGYGFVFNL